MCIRDRYWVMDAVEREHPDFIYSDEDKVTEDGRVYFAAHFKPDYCPDNLRSGNYICHLMVMRRSLMDAAGGFRSAFDGSQDHDLAPVSYTHLIKPLQLAGRIIMENGGETYRVEETVTRMRCV